MIRKFIIILAKLSLIAFVVTLGVILILPATAKADEDKNAYVNVIALDQNGNKVTNLNYNIYEQKTDVNGNSILGNRLGGDWIDQSGQKQTSIWLNDSYSKNIAVEYFINDRNSEKFIVWNYQIKRGALTNITVYLSSVKIILRDTDNVLLKDLPFSIYTAVTDVNNKLVAKDQLYGDLRTEYTGQRVIYLIPGNYKLRIQYSGLGYKSDYDLDFAISQNSQKIMDLTLNTINFGVSQGGKLQTNVDFKVYIQNSDLAINNGFQYIGTFSTGDAGYRKIYLPDGYYRLEYWDNQANSTKFNEFKLQSGQAQQFINNTGSFVLKVLDEEENPLKGHYVTIYNSYGVKILQTVTNQDGIMAIDLTPGYYNIKIEGIYHGLDYNLKNFYVSNQNNNEIDYILSSATIHFQNQAGNEVDNVVFNLYNYSYAGPNVISTGDKIGTFSTGNLGYFKIYLPGGEYVVENNKKLYLINVVANQTNGFYVNLDSNYTIPISTNYNNNVNNNNPSNINSGDPYQITNLAINQLYQTDSDYDGLPDFVEVYMYRTNPYSVDSDNDGFSDKDEIKSGYNPNGPGQYSYSIFSYDKPRLISLSMEQSIAVDLKTALESKFGKNNIKVSDKDWHTLVNSYIYGGYSVSEIINTLVYGPGQVHPTIPAIAWRKVSGVNLAIR
ncbi:MAG: thrombospondin type 3 repeat-containing protein [Candidatus Parcubacteria bacterium]|nr:thrombospondin type 3 repeat-containing protein [Candidatus Parcubacteria bacterium]